MQTPYEEGASILNSRLAEINGLSEGNALATPTALTVTGATQAAELTALLTGDEDGFFSTLSDVALATPGFIVDTLPKYVASSLVAGTAQLYNAAIDLIPGPTSFEHRADPYAIAAGINQSLANFYAENEEGVDLGGFILSSIVPGLGGIKVLHWGQASLNGALKAGNMSKTMQRATGILVPQRTKHLNAAIKEVVTSNSLPRLTETNLLAAFRAGAHQQVLEAVAFETMVAATLSNSPILENQDVGDLITNIAFSGVAFGAIGGVVSGAKAYSTVKRAADASDASLGALSSRLGLAEVTALEQEASLYLKQLNDIPEVTDDLIKNYEGAIQGDRRVYLENTRKKKIEDLTGDFRRVIGEIAGGDQTIAAATYNSVLNSADYLDRVGITIGLKEVNRVLEISSTEIRLTVLESKLLKGTATEAEHAEFMNLNVGYRKNHSGDTSAVLQSETPVMTGVADVAIKGEDIVVTAAGVKIGMPTGVGGKVNARLTFNHDALASGNYDASTIGVIESNSRHVWAQNGLEPFSAWKTNKPIRISDKDPALLEKVYREYDDAVARGVTITVNGVDTPLVVGGKALFLKDVARYKDELAANIHSKTLTGNISSDVEATITKLRELTGVNFVAKRRADMMSPSANGQYNFHQNRADPFSLNPVPANSAQGYSRIALQYESLTSRPLHDLVTTLLHEEGHHKFKNILAYGGIKRGTEKDILREMEVISRKLRVDNWAAVDSIRKKGVHTTQHDLDFIDYMYNQEELAADTFSYFAQWYKEGAELAPGFAAQFGNKVNKLPKEVVASYSKRAAMLSDSEVAAILNVRTSYLSEGRITNPADPNSYLFAMQGYAEEYAEKLLKNRSVSSNTETVQLYKIPKYSKVSYDSKGLHNLDSNQVENMAIYMEMQNINAEALNRAVTGNLRELLTHFPDATDLNINTANRSGAGAKGLTTNNANYGTLSSSMDQLGDQTEGLIEALRGAARELITPSMIKLANNPAAAVEYSVLNARVRNIPENYIIDPVTKGFKHEAIAKWEVKLINAEAKFKAVQEAVPDPTKTSRSIKAALSRTQKELEKLKNNKPVIATRDAPEFIPITHKEGLELAQAHVKLNGARIRGYASIRNAQGIPYNRNPDVFYPPPVDINQFKHFAIVVDESITAGWGRHTTLYATTSEELASQITKVTQNNPHLTPRTAGAAEKYYNDIGQFADEKAITDNYLDIEKHRNGVSAPHFPQTDPKRIVDDLLSWHMQREAGYARENVLAKYERQFEELRMLGDSFTDIQTSQFSNIRKLKYVQEAVVNPYQDYIKTGLAVARSETYPLWSNGNRLLDEKISKLYRSVSGAVHSSKSLKDLDVVNAQLEQAGYKGAAYDADMAMFANATMARGDLNNFVRRSNAVLATITLRLDFVNAINNAVSANVLLGSEVTAIIRGIERGDDYAVGALAQLGKITVPGTNLQTLNGTKLTANAFKAYHKILSGGDPAALEFFRSNRFLTSITQQNYSMIDSLAMHGTESAQQASSKISTVVNGLKTLADKGERVTGNRLAEEMNRFVAAHVMKEITDIAVGAGLMKPKQALSYINTFVNRTQANYTASQRPNVFKGAVGQAIGLFQTYQFNLIQQLLRHVGEGSAKDSMTLLAMQGTIHGMNGLPGFQAINQHIIGTASGNKEHKDAYTATYGLVGKEAGDWAMYGVGSNLLGLLHPDLKANLYTRGDINPRHITIIPTSITELPLVTAYSKFFSNMYEAGKEVGQGGNVGNAILQGIEHNGISRPLAGLAQSLEALTNDNLVSYSTSNAGNVNAANDLLSFATLTRLAGAKPLDEAVALDATYRINAYALKDKKKTSQLGESFKTHLTGGGLPDTATLLGFMGSYMEGGGKQENFSKWARSMYKSANLSQANKLAQDLNSWEAQSMQRVMGGEELPDFYDVPTLNQ